MGKAASLFTWPQCPRAIATITQVSTLQSGPLSPFGSPGGKMMTLCPLPIPGGTVPQAGPGVPS